MVSELELRVREMDDETVKVSVMARRIANKFEEDVSEGHIRNILFAKRGGYGSWTEYINKKIRKKGFKRRVDYEEYLAQKRGLKGLKEYKEEVYRRLGFLSNSEYCNYIRHKEKGHFKNLEEYLDKEGLSKRLEYRNPKDIPEVASEKDYSLIGILEAEDKKEQIKLLLEKCLNDLDEEDREIITSRYYEGKTLEEIRKELKVTNEGVRQIEIKAIKRLYFLAKKYGLDELYFEK